MIKENWGLKFLSHRDLLGNEGRKALDACVCVLVSGPAGYGKSSVKSIAKLVPFKEGPTSRRETLKRECEKATADPDTRQRYSWLVAQRRVRDCFDGKLEGDKKLLEDDPDDLYSIIDIHDAVVRYEETSFAERYPSGSGFCFDRKKKIDALRVDIEREYEDAMKSNVKELLEYSLDEAKQRVTDCYAGKFPKGAEIFAMKMNENGMPQTDQTYNIFDIRKALQLFDEKKLVQKFPEDEGPGSHELKKSIEENNFAVKKEYLEARCRLPKYSYIEAECRVRDCFSDSLQEETEIFPIVENDIGTSDINLPTFDIIDIHKAFLHFDKCKFPIELSDSIKENRCVMKTEYAKAVGSLRTYSRSEAERRVRDCFVGIFPEDTDVFSTYKEKSGIPKIHQTYDIFDIKDALDHLELKKPFEKDPELVEEQSKHSSGFIVHDHFIITSNCVTGETLPDKITEVHIFNSTIGKLPCVVANYDAGKDLALLYCQELYLKQNGICPLQLSNLPLLPGMQVFSFGYSMNHTTETALVVNGHVSGSMEMSGYTMVTLDCKLGSGYSGAPVLCRVNGKLKVLGVLHTMQKHNEGILTCNEREQIKKIQKTLKAGNITSCSHDHRQKAKHLLALKLYDALETHSQFSASNALPGHFVIEFIKETCRKYKGEGKDELVDIIREEL